MKRRALSLLAATTLLLTMLPLVFITATAAGAADLTAGLEKAVVQNFGDYEPWGANVWYNASLTDVPGSNADKGLYFSEGGVNHGAANIQIKKLADADISEAKYFVLTFQKNSLTSGNTFRLVLQFILGSDYVLANNTVVYYDNGGAELQSVAIQNSDEWNREMTLTVGSSDTVTAYIPVENIVFAYNQSVQASADALKSVEAVSLNFTDLGNKDNASIANTDAVSVKEMAMFVPKSVVPGPQPVEWIPDGDKIILQDFDGMSGELADIQVKEQWGEGHKLTVTDGGAQLVENKTLSAEHPAGYFFLKDIDEHDWSNAEWLAMTLKVNAAPGTSANTQHRPGLNLALGANVGEAAYILHDANPPAESRYWTKDGKAYEMTEKGNDTFYYADAGAGVAVGDSITVYVKVSELAYQWDANSKLSALSQIDGVWLGMPYDTDGKPMASVISPLNQRRLKR